MQTSTVNIAFKKDLLKQIDLIARQESRSRSELIREAARLYLERKERWEDIFAFGRSQAKKRKLKQPDVASEIARYRKSLRRS